MPRLFTILAAFLLWAAAAVTPAHADIAAARAAYERGAYEEAANAAEAAGAYEGHALAARALLARALFAAQPVSDDVLARAERNASQALALDGDSVDARLDLALALGLQGRRASIGEALRRHFAPRGRALIEEALQRAPDHPRALAMLGGWHLEVLRRAGTAGALFLGARYERGVAAFARARALAPEDPSIALHYAIALIGLNARKHEDQARALLAEAASAQPRNPFERALCEEAQRIGMVMTTSGARAAALMVNKRRL